MMLRRSSTRVLTMTFAGFVACVAAGCDTGSADEVTLEPCPALAPEAAATISVYSLPRGWSLSDAVAIDALDRVRGSDGAPVSYVGAWILDASGARVADTPMLMIAEGGTKKEHETYGKNHHTLNDIAVQITDSAYAEALHRDPSSTRLPRRDARSLRTPYSESDSAAVAVLTCLSTSS